ncbi:MAG: hypothetical protein PHF51_02535 [Candidatus ainarchaeum sp.]|nr:hypothetical protein [Candidatus ainarchaeum sp.]
MDMTFSGSEDLRFSRELRSWIKLFQGQQNIKKIEAFSATLNELRVAFSNLNSEMKAFNENSTKSNEFLGKIARLQESMENQTKAANMLTGVMAALVVLQIVLTLIQIGVIG